MILLFILLTLLVSPVQAQVLGLYADAECTECNLNVASGSSAEFYVGINTQGDDLTDLCGGSFRITGFPEDWVAGTAMPTAFVGSFSGNPLVEGIFFSPAAPLAGNCIPLFRIPLFATSASEHMFSIEAHTMAPPQQSCPQLSLSRNMCHASCVPVEPLRVNSATSCVVAAEQSTWSSIKKLYNH